MLTMRTQHQRAQKDRLFYSELHVFTFPGGYRKRSLPFAQLTRRRKVSKTFCCSSRETCLTTGTACDCGNFKILEDFVHYSKGFSATADIIQTFLYLYRLSLNILTTYQ